MQAHELLNELRRNPAQNPKVFGHAGALQTLQNMNTENLGVSMTELPKLGINPGSQYATPVGVYFYPASYYKETKEGGDKLDFQDGADYIQIFKYTGDVTSGSVIHTDKFGKIDFEEYVGMLFSNINHVARLIGTNESNATKELSRHIVGSLAGAKVPTYFGRLWYVLWALSKSSGQQKRGAAAPRSAVIWNSLLRTMGVDVIIDNGDAVLHENEPYQGVVLNPRVIQMVATILNTDETEAKRTKSVAKKNSGEDMGVLINNETAGSKLFYVEAAFGEDGYTLAKCRVYAATQNIAADLATKWAKKYVGSEPLYHVLCTQLS